MVWLGWGRKKKSLGSGQEGFMFCFNTPGLMKNIQSCFRQNTAGNSFDVPLKTSGTQTQQENVQTSWLKIPRTVTFENVATPRSPSLQTLITIFPFIPQTSKLTEHDMTGIVEMFIKVFRIIQTLFSIHWLSNRPSPTKENSVMLLLVRKWDSRVPVLQHVGFFSHCVLYFLKNDLQFNNSQTKAHERNTFIQLSYSVYNVVISHSLEHDKYVK